MPKPWCAGKPAGRLEKGVLLLADLSGFTRMSERLCRMGKTGTEELTAILSDYFDVMLKTVKKRGGLITKFIGDAILAQFGTKSNAAACAREMMSAMSRFSRLETSAGGFELKMKIVVAVGDWIEFVVGDRRRAEYFICGRLIKELAMTEDRANAGDILFTKSLTRDRRRRMPLTDVEFLGGDVVEASFLPEGAGAFIGRGFFGEHRMIASVFVKFAGYDEDAPELMKLQSIFSDIIDIVSRYGGSIHDLDNVSVDGSGILIVFGAPVSSGSDIRRAVSAGKDISSVLSQYEGMKIKVGIHAGYAYTGITGNAWRRQYTVIGDVVNTAARLVTTAPEGGVVVSEDVVRLSNRDFEFTEIEAMTVKGKARSLKRFLPGRDKETAEHRVEFAGREKEIDLMMKYQKEGGKVLILTGEAGIGKTRLLDELAARLAGKGHTVARGMTDGLKPAFDLFSTLVRQIAGIRDDDLPALKKKKLENACRVNVGAAGQREEEGLEELKRKLPFIGTMLLGLEYADSLYGQLNPELRYSNLLEGIRLFIEYLPQPVVIMLDDLQWAKKEDQEAIAYLSRALVKMSGRDIRFILAMRPEMKAAALPLDPDIERTEIELEGLDGQALDRVMSGLLGGLAVEPELADTIKRKAEGNPFYLEQLVTLLKEKGLIRSDGQKWNKSEEFGTATLPENVFSTIMARFDRLAEPAKDAVRVASVVGFDFSEKIVEGVRHEPVRSCLSAAVSEKLIDFQDPTGRKYVFSQNMIRDVIYDSLLRRQRISIHRAVAETIELRHRDALPLFYERLAHHYTYAEQWQRAVNFRMKAGQKSMGDYKNEDAINHFEEILQITRTRLKNKRMDLLPVWEALGRIHVLRGEYEKAKNCYHAMADNAVNKTVSGIRALQGVADVLENQGRYDEALDVLAEMEKKLTTKAEVPDRLFYAAMISMLKCWIYRILGRVDEAIKAGRWALDIFERLGKDARAGEMMVDNYRITVLTHLAAVYLEQGKHGKAVKYYRDSIRFAEKTGDKRRIATGSGSLGIIYVEKGDYERALALYQRDLEISEEIGDMRGISGVCGRMANLYRTLGEYEKAAGLHQRALQISEKMGDKHNIGVAAGNLANVLFYQGRYDQALDLYRQTLKISEELGYKKGVGLAMLNIGCVYTLQGRSEEALEQLGKALILFEEIRYAFLIGAALITMATALRDKGDLNRADEHLARAEKISIEIGAKPMLIEIYAGIAETAMKKGDLERALAYAGLMKKVCVEAGSKPDQGLCHMTFGNLYSRSGDQARAAAEFEEAIAVFSELRQKESLATAHQEYAEMLERSAGKGTVRIDKAVRHRVEAERLFRELKLLHRIG